MSWIITGTEKNPVDLYRSQVSLLLHGDGTNGSTTIVDSSPTPKTVTAFGDAQISTAQSKFGGTSIAFDGSGDYIAVADSDDFYFDGDLTIEAWVYLTTQGSAFKYIFAQWVDGEGNDRNFSFNSLGEFYMNRSGSTFSSSIGALSVDSWTFIAISLQGTTLRGFKNGVLAATTTVSGAANNSTAPFGVGAYGNGNFPFNGYIDDLRITKGVARYTANFTPPTAPFPDF